MLVIGEIFGERKILLSDVVTPPQYHDNLSIYLDKSVDTKCPGQRTLSNPETKSMKENRQQQINFSKKIFAVISLLDINGVWIIADPTLKINHL